MTETEMRNNCFNGSPGSSGDNSELLRRRPIRGDRSRRSWSDKEEATLIIALKDLVVTGWKSDNGFRAGYLTRIEEALKRDFPNTDLRAQPHIQSKITTWKRFYSTLAMILDRSGVGFNNHGDYKIDCDDDQWSQIVQKDNSAKYMRNKSWPHWEAWKEIYGKDRASGDRGKGAEEAMNKMKATQENINAYEGDYYVNLEEFFDDEVMLDHVMPATADGSQLNEVTSPKKSVKKINKKRKAVDKVDGYLDLMNQMHAETNDRLQTLSTRIGYEFDQSVKRSEVYKLLGVIPGLTMKHKFYTSAKLVKEPELLDLFTSMPEIDRPDFVVFLLETDGVLGG